jgi:hypothetical protein
LQAVTLGHSRTSLDWTLATSETAHIDLNLASGREVNFTLGVDVRGAIDHLVAKMLLGYHFDF